MKRVQTIVFGALVKETEHDVFTMLISRSRNKSIATSHNEIISVRQ